MVEICESLKNERIKRGISLKQISRKTNISVNSLKALEDGDIDHIPGKFYIKHYLKNYLEAIEVDHKEFFTNHQNWFEANSFNSRNSSEKYIPKLRYSRFKRRNLTLTLSSVLFLLIILAAGFSYLFKQGMLPDWFNLSESTKLPPTGLIIDETNIKFSVDRSPINIRLDFIDTCWTLVGRGKTARVEKTYEKGDRLILRGYELFLYLGNPSSVKFYLNDREVSYLKKSTKPEKLEITPATITRILER
jgi:transcriptional regulator with XRE-family HTH domain